QLIALGMLALQVNLDEVERGVIAPPEMVSFESLPDGAQVLKPVPDKIRQLRDSIFAGTGAISPGLDGDPAEGARVEQARVRVLNGSGSEGLATETGDYLTQQGLNIVEVSNADRQDYDKSRLIVHNRTNPYTIRYLAALFGMTEGQILNPVNGAESGVDIVLILGADWAFADRP
ncbi:MAG TPA: LytR C-terminal domain-containing protein, partial [Anaerolineales bacterium]